MFKVTILTISPELFPGTLGFSLAGAALKKNIWSLNIIDIRDFGRTKHKNIDDIAYGGGSGMVMRADVAGPAIDFALEQNPGAKLIYMSPRGNRLDQQLTYGLSRLNNLIILCGRFEGIDQRIIDYYNISEISIGDYVLSGGELAAMVLLDSCIRLLPGVISNQEATLSEESFTKCEQGLMLEYPLYTRPVEWRSLRVPHVLTTGHHKNIKVWKSLESYNITKLKRPDLLNKTGE